MNDLVALHREEYDAGPEVMVSAPGVLNILGEHTEHTGGFALPVAINRAIRVAISTRRDGGLRFFTATYKERKRTSLASLRYKKEDRWANLPKGVIFGLLRDGASMKGLDVTILGDIPPGIGLASSSALALAAATGVDALLGLGLGPERVIDYARFAEAEFMEKETGVIDYLAGMYAKRGTALLIDTASRDYTYVPLLLGKAALLVTNSQVPLNTQSKEQQQRWKDCERCIEILGARRSKATLRDISPRDIRESVGSLPETTRRRCLHIVEENRRVKDAAELLRKRNLGGLGKLLNRSHESLRDLFEISCPELDWLVKRSQEIEGVYGARLTGSGFGGCTITILQESALEPYRRRLEDYERIFGFKAESFACEPSDGVHVF